MARTIKEKTRMAGSKRHHAGKTRRIAREAWAGGYMQTNLPEKGATQNHGV